MTDSESLVDTKRQLREIAACPIDWVAFGTPLSLREAVIEHWQRFAEQCDVDLDGEYANPRTIEIDDDLETLTAGLHNWRLWGDEAKSRFRNLVLPLLETRAMGRDEYSRHYPTVGWSEETIRAETLIRDSLLYPGLAPEYQTALLREPMASFFDDFLNFAKDNRTFLYIYAEHPVGACRGQETTILLYDIQWGARRMHAYPALDGDRDFKYQTFASWLPAPAE